MDKKLVTFFGFGVFVSFLVISLIVLIELSQLEQGIKDLIAGYGLIGIFFIAFMTDMIMQPIGPDVPMIAGIIVGVNPFLAFLSAVAGSILATLIGYYLGRVYGEAGFMRYYGFVRYNKWRRLYEKYGKVIVLVAALTPVPYVPICWLSGIFEMKRSEFLIFGVGGRALRLFTVMYLTTQIFQRMMGM